MDKDTKQILIVCTVLLLVVANIAVAICYHRKLMVDGGYEQRMVPGHNNPVWVKPSEPAERY